MVFRNNYCRHKNLYNISTFLRKFTKTTIPEDITLNKPFFPMLLKNLTKENCPKVKGPYIIQYKYDGIRSLIHLNKVDNDFKIYSRKETRLEYIESLLSPVLQNVLQNIKTSMILDSEIVACDKAFNILPFQVISTVITRKIQINNNKKNKDDDEEEERLKDLKLKIIPFDVLYFKDKSLTNTKLSERIKLLHENIKESNEMNFPIEYTKPEIDLNSIEKYTKEAKENKCEGIVIKEINSLYYPDKRTNHWLKYKYDYTGLGIRNSYDLVVLGGYNGKGKLNKVYSSFILGCKDNNDRYIPCAKVGTGFTYEMLENISNSIKLDEMKDIESDDELLKKFKPDIVVKPSIIVEITFSSFSLSPKYVIGKNIVDNKKGIGFRFPKFVRIRDDKKLNDITTCNDVIEDYKSSKS